MQLFDDNFIYPSDVNGRYIELEGEVILVNESLGDSCVVTVSTDSGVFTGYTISKYAPAVGYWAKIKIYDCGGGHYPDNEIREWSVKKP